MSDIEPKFLARIRQKHVKPADGASAPDTKESSFSVRDLLRDGAYGAQILIVVVVIIGYVYTVQPIYQKERLAEEVAHNELRISEQNEQLQVSNANLKDIQARESDALERATQLQSEIDDLERGRDRVIAQVADLSREFENLKAEKLAVESQMNFMQFKYFLPDGSPADSDEEVAQAIKFKNEKVAQLARLRFYAKYFSDIEFSWSIKKYNNVFNPNLPALPLVQSNFDVDDSAEFYPFTLEEIELWRKHGAEFPRWAALNEIEISKHEDIDAELESDSPHISATDVASWRALAVTLVSDNSRDWQPPFDPLEYSASVRNRLETVEAELAENLSRDGSSVFNPGRDLTHKQNAARQRLEISEPAWVEANKFRSSIADRISILLDFELPPLESE